MAAEMEGMLPPSAAATPSNAYTAASQPIVVIGEQFIVPYTVEINIEQTFFTVNENNFDVINDNGNPVFKIKDKLFSFPYRRLLLDAKGNTLVSLIKKVPSVHKGWKVFRGDSEKSSDYLFRVRKSSIKLHLRTKSKAKPAAALDVFLASNTNKSQPNFRITEGCRDSGCSIFAGDAIIGQMQRNRKVESLVVHAESYRITAYPNVDYAFIVALVVLFDEIHRIAFDCKPSSSA